MRRCLVPFLLAAALVAATTSVLTGCDLLTRNSTSQSSLRSASEQDTGALPQTSPLVMARHMTFRQFQELLNKDALDLDYREAFEDELDNLLQKVPEESFAFVGRIEARKKFSADLTDGRMLLVNGLVLPPAATVRLILQFKKAFAEYEAKHSNAIIPEAALNDRDRARYEHYYGAEQESLFRFVSCKERLNPGEYTPKSITNALKRLLRRGSSAGADPLTELAQCGQVFSHADYYKWELDFLIEEVDGELFQEVHVRTRQGWAYRLFHGPLDGHNELGKTVIFRRKMPLPETVHLQVFGNVSQPEPKLFFNVKTKETLPVEVRDEIFESIGGGQQTLQNWLRDEFVKLQRFTNDTAHKEALQNLGRVATLHDVSELFKQGRMMNFISNIAAQSGRLATVPVTAHALQNGFVSLAHFEIVDAIAPSGVGASVVSLLTHHVLPLSFLTVVLAGRIFDATEIDYFIRQAEFGENPQFRSFMKLFHVIDAILVGTAVIDFVTFVNSELPNVLSVLAAGNFVRLAHLGFRLATRGPQTTQAAINAIRESRLVEAGVQSQSENQLTQTMLKRRKELQSVMRKYRNHVLSHLRLPARASKKSEAQQSKEHVRALVDRLEAEARKAESERKKPQKAMKEVRELFRLLSLEAHCFALEQPETATIFADKTTNPQIVVDALKQEVGCDEHEKQ